MHFVTPNYLNFSNLTKMNLQL